MMATELRAIGLTGFILSLGMLLSPLAAGQQAGTVESKLEQRKVVQKEGKELFESAASVRPGDVVEYVVTYSNKGKAAVSNLEATLPIPADTELILGSLKPAVAKGSTGGSLFADLPLKQKVKLPDGKEAEREVPAREYRALRWAHGNLAAGQSVNFSARVKISDDRPAAVIPKK